MHEKGVDAVLARMTMQFKTPLRPDDEFVSRLRLTKEGIKYVFHHDISRVSDDRLCFRAQAELVCIVNGRLSGSEDYDRAFAPYIE
jgi:acyl-CoA thioester hydrolase